MSWDGTKKRTSKRQIRPPEDGLTSGSGSGGWLGKRLDASLNALQGSHRAVLARGRTLASAGRVRAFWLSPGIVSAEVWDDRPLEVRLRFQTFEPETWELVIDELSSDLRRVAALVEGRMPKPWLDSLDRRDLRMLPSWRRKWFDEDGIERSDIEGDCDCGEDWQQPCDHMVALHHVLASGLDADPFQLFTVRGRDRGWVFTSLRSRWGDRKRSGSEEAEEAPMGEGWFGTQTPRPNLTLRPAPPQATAVGLDALGPAPGDEDLHYALDPLYIAGAAAAELLLLSEGTAVAPTRQKPHRSPELTQTSTVPAASSSSQEASEHDLFEQIVDILAEGEGLKAAVIEARLQLDKAILRQHLKALEDAGMVYRTGRTRGTLWHLG